MAVKPECNRELAKGGAGRPGPPGYPSVRIPGFHSIAFAEQVDDDVSTDEARRARDRDGAPGGDGRHGGGWRQGPAGGSFSRYIYTRIQYPESYIGNIVLLQPY